MITVACMLWHDASTQPKRGYGYGPSNVALLAAMVRRNLGRPHRFVCLTDDPEERAREAGFEGHNAVEWLNLDRRTHILGKRTAKLMLFRRDIGELLGERILYIDLDSVVVGPLDPLVDHGAPLVLWRNPHYGERRQYAPFNSSVMLIRPGCLPEVYERFRPTERICTPWSADDQDIISLHAPADVAAWTEADGVWNQSQLPRDPAHTSGFCSKLPAGARIVTFPGKREPGLRSVQHVHPWIVEHRRP